MSKLLAALIGAGVAVGVGYVIWRVRKERDRKAKDEAAKRESGAAQASDAKAVQRPSVSAEAPTANEATPAAPPVSSSPVSPAPAAGSSTPTLDQLADAGKPEPQTAPEPAPTPKTDAARVEPTPEPRPANPDAPITRSTYDKRTRHVHESPESLLEQARRIIPDLTLTEYTAARMLASERFRGTPTEWAELNRSPKDLDRLTEQIAPRGAYGDQGSGGRRVDTTRDPAFVHVEAARHVLGGEQRGRRNGETSTRSAIP